MDFFFSAELWVALLTLSLLEIVLGVDNLVFVSISVARLPEHLRSRARRFGLAVACVTRILLLLSLALLARMSDPLFTLYGTDFSVRDLILIGGGLFLLTKSTLEIHQSLETAGDEELEARKPIPFSWVIMQIAIIDIVFSLDSVITAVGMVNNIPIMVAAIVIAVLGMIFAADPIGEFIERNPTVKMLALAFLLLVGMALVADGLDFYIPRSYLYFAMAFSAGVEGLNLTVKHRQRK